MIMEQYFQQQITTIEAYLKNLIPTEKTLYSTVFEAMDYSLQAGGKRIRPVLCMEFYKVCGGQGEVAAVTGSLSMLGHRQRIEGFRSQLEAEFPSMTLVEVVENNDDDAVSSEAVTELFHRTSPRGLYFGAAGAAAGSRTAHALAKGPLSIVVSDPVPAVARLIERGLVQAAISQQPFEQGYRAMRVIIERLLFHSKPSDDQIFTQNEIKIKTNL